MPTSCTRRTRSPPPQPRKRSGSACIAAPTSSAASASGTAISSSYPTWNGFSLRRTAGAARQVPCGHAPDSTEQDMRFSIKLKLGLAFGTVILLSAATAGVGISSLASIKAMTDRLIDRSVQRTILAEQLGADLLRVERAEKNLILSASKDQIESYDADILKRRQDLVGEQAKLDTLSNPATKQKLAAFA